MGLTATFIILIFQMGQMRSKYRNHHYIMECHLTIPSSNENIVGRPSELSNSVNPPPRAETSPAQKSKEELEQEKKANEEAAKRFSAQLSGDWNSKILEMEKNKKSKD